MGVIKVSPQTIPLIRKAWRSSYREIIGPIGRLAGSGLDVWLGKLLGGVAASSKYKTLSIYHCYILLLMSLYWICLYIKLHQVSQISVRQECEGMTEIQDLFV